jgi:hypothetical protein
VFQKLTQLSLITEKNIILIALPALLNWWMTRLRVRGIDPNSNSLRWLWMTKENEWGKHTRIPRFCCTARYENTLKWNFPMFQLHPGHFVIRVAPEILWDETLVISLRHLGFWHTGCLLHPASLTFL